MDPKISKRLMETVPEMEDFIKYIKYKIKEIDSVFTISVTNAVDSAVEVRARQIAIEKMVEIMNPLVNLQEFEPSNHEEFSVNVE